jgi:ornithine cyclodeaminase/alanine dehydrogenase-like protein (mu-crystallin family)
MLNLGPSYRSQGPCSEEIVSKVSPSAALVAAVEDAFSQLAQGKVDVPMPMHIGIGETAAAGPGDCHVKGGYIEGAPTWTVKLACVSFYNNVAKGLPAGSGVFVVCDAANGAPKVGFHTTLGFHTAFLVGSMMLSVRFLNYAGCV